MTLQIRKPRTEDADAIARMVHALAAHHGDTARVDADWIAEFVIEGEGGVGCLLAESGKEPVGYAIWYPILNAVVGARIVDLHHLYVHAGYRGTGIGRAMVRRIVEIANRDRFARVALGVSASNEDARRFYLRLGFREGKASAQRLVLDSGGFEALLTAG